MRAEDLSCALDRLAGVGRGAGVALVVAHPDDETLILGGRLQRLPKALVVHVTDGAPRRLADARRLGFATAEDYAAARARELAQALGIAGIAPERSVSLGVPDQEAARDMAEVARRLADLFRAHETRLVVTHAFEGGHPDHDASAFAVAAAVRRLGRGGHGAPAVLDAPLYHVGPDGPTFQTFADGEEGIVLPITRDELATKRRMIAAHASQAGTLGTFDPAVERVRPAPASDFAALPNGGRVLWDDWRLGVSPAEWPSLAAGALAELEEASP